MKNTLKLDNPITINGKSVSELTYDCDEITAAHFAEADVKRKIAAGLKNISISPSAELDVSLHLYLGFAAIVAANTAYSFDDVERIHGTDLIAVMKIGRNFITKSGASARSSSDEQSETTAKPSTQAQPTSNENE